MARTALYAPASRVLAKIFTGAGATAVPTDAAPSIDYLGMGMQDHRIRYDTLNSATGAGALGFYGNDPILCVNQVPSTIATANIAALQAAVSGTAMTLVSSSGSGITVLAASTLIWPGSVNTPLTTGLVIDSTPLLKRFGTHFRTAFYDRNTMISRAVSITSAAGGAGSGNFTVRGYDLYGYALTETIAYPGANTTTNGKKAFKVIASVTPDFSNAGTYSVGTTDIYGFPIQCSVWADCFIHWNSALVTASTGFVAPDTNTATATTGDVRGTYALQAASNATLRLTLRVSPSLSLTNVNATTGLFGVAQFGS